jgi:hypothetical protein
MKELPVARLPAAELLSMQHSSAESRKDVAAYWGNEPAVDSIEVGRAKIGEHVAVARNVVEVCYFANWFHFENAPRHSHCLLEIEAGEEASSFPGLQASPSY